MIADEPIYSITSKITTTQTLISSILHKYVSGGWRNLMANKEN